jgi:uncharacterized protein
MEEHDNEQRFQQILRSNAWFMALLEAVRDCAIPEWAVGGGVIRNLVWDHLHGYPRPTPVADVDVAFFDPDDLCREREQAVEQALRERLPHVPWDVKNQAAVHLWYERVFGHAVAPLQSLEEAVSTWPETATSVAVRLAANDELLVVAPFGLEDLFQMILRRNPRRVSLEQFRRRVGDKRIPQKWPMVRIIDG